MREPCFRCGAWRRADIHEFLERVQGVSASDPLVEQLREITEGNLFFLHEVVRQMTSQGRIDGDHAIDAKRLGVTRGVSDFIKKLAQPLSKDARSALDVAAVIGREFSLDALAAASDKPPDDLVELLDEAISLELIDESPGARGRYSFRHALIREALYDALPASTRRRFHRAIAEAVRAMRGRVEPAAEIAYHYCQAGSADTAELAIEYSRQASRVAGKQLAYEEAASHLRNAIEALHLRRNGGERLHAELLCELGEAQVRSGDLAEGRRTCLSAAELARQAERAGSVRPGDRDGRPRRQQFRPDRRGARPSAQRGAGKARRRGQPVARAGAGAGRRRALLVGPEAVGRPLPAGG